MVEPPSEDYDDLTVKEVKARVESGEYDVLPVYRYENANKQRVTLTRWLDDRLPAPEPEEVVVAPTRTRRVANFWIDEEDVHEPITVKRTPQIEEAIDAGDLQVIDQ